MMFRRFWLWRILPKIRAPTRDESTVRLLAKPGPVGHHRGQDIDNKSNRDVMRKMRTEQVAALLNPTSIAILGARENPSGWTARIFANLQRFDFSGPFWPVNPRAEEMWGVTCYPDLASLPEPPDHLVIMRAADTVPDILREGAACGVRSATIYGVGFSETGTDEGRRREDVLRGVLEETGIAISGPNCLGNLSAAARVLTLPDDRIRELVAGPVAMVGQSGTTTPAIGRLMIDRGIDCSYIITSGNETGLTAADYISYFTEDPNVLVIFCLIEAVRDPLNFLAVCRKARDAGKPVVAIKMGGSAQGREAALAHTGSLAGSHEAFDAVAGDAGVIRVDSADQAADLVDFLVRAPIPSRPEVGVLTYSGGVRGLAAEAAAKYGLTIPPFCDETVKRMKVILGEDFLVTNPLDAMGFFNHGADVVAGLVEAAFADPGIGTVLIQEDLPPSEGHTDANKRRARRVLETMKKIDSDLLTRGDAKPFAMSSATTCELTEYSRAARQDFPRVALLNEPERAMRALRRILDYGEVCKWAVAAAPPPTATHSPVAQQLRKTAKGGPGDQIPVSETLSKTLLAEYGIPIPTEEIALTADDAVKAAEKIGYPVVLKGLGVALTHKSDAGAVLVGLSDGDAVRDGFALIHSNVAAYAPDITLDGVLVASAVSGGLELVIGINSDPEMGPVVMFGTGGIWLELFKDVAFAAPGLDRAGAERMIAATRAGTLIDGYRGAAAYDRDALIDTLIKAGRIAADLDGTLESLDINPFSLLEAGRGGYALDALAVLKGEG